MKNKCRKKFSSGYARRCAEKLCFSVSFAANSAAAPPIFAGKFGRGGKDGGAAAKKESKPDGKAQLFRTSGGRAALFLIITVFIFQRPLDGDRPQSAAVEAA